MASFYTITILVLSALFLISLVTILYLTYTQESKSAGADVSKPYPPIQQKCPDLWQYDDTTKKCIATLATPDSQNLSRNFGTFVNSASGTYAPTQVTTLASELRSLVYTPSTSTTAAKLEFDPDDAYFGQTTAQNCGRKKFSILTNLHWEGISNYGPC